MITLHGTAKRFSDGYVPMITMRADKGRMIGAKCPEGAYREFRTFTSEHEATVEARLICCRIAQRFPDVLKAAL